MTGIEASLLVLVCLSLFLNGVLLFRTQNNENAIASVIDIVNDKVL
jgi:hypothetical protein